MNNPCPICIPCGDYPFVNLSSEGPEPFWLPPRGQYWTAQGHCCDSTLRNAFSTVSQEDANNVLDQTLSTACPDCADDQQLYCAKAFCAADGSQITEICVPTSQSDADAMADAVEQANAGICGPLYFADAKCPDDTPLGTYMSRISQSDADTIAANMAAALLPFCGGTFYYADANCANGTFLGRYCSPESQEVADALAAAAVASFADLCNIFVSVCACPDGVTDIQTVTSTISQAVADAQCAKIPKNCAGTPPNPPTPGTDPDSNGADGAYSNDAMGCTVLCPDGSQFSWVTPAHTLFAQTKAQANALAYANACLNAQAHKTCMSNLSPSSCCKDSPATLYVSVSGQGNFGWAITSGSLPTGMSLGLVGPNSAMIYGTPSTAGAFTFTLRATNASGTYMEKSFTVHVIGFTTASLPDGDVGVTYSQQVQAQGGTGNYDYSISAGALPDGLSMDAAGNITGTPTTDGTFTFTVLVQDSAL